LPRMWTTCVSAVRGVITSRAATSR
jgi:hypothetical protein